MRRAIRFLRKGRVVAIADPDPRQTVLDWLRLDEGSTGTKEGCNEGDCGACTVVLARREEGGVSHRPVCACITLLGQLDGAELLTVEDLASDGRLHPVQEAMVARHASQCGFCTPGIVMSLYALHRQPERPAGRQAVVDALAGNLCRCTGYRPIVDAALDALGSPPELRDGAAERLAAFDGGDDLFAGTDERFFAAPATLDGVCALLGRFPDATVIGGATDVGLWITKALRPIERIVWLGRVRELQRIEQRDGVLRLRAGVTLARAAAPLAAVDPDLGEIVRRFGSAQVRSTGTVGGSIANGSPIGDLAPPLIALGATLHLRHGDRERALPLERFFLDYRKQDRAPGELVTALDVPFLQRNERFRAFKLTKRFDEDISAVLLALKATLEGDRVVAARVALGGVAGVPRRAEQAEAALRGVLLRASGDWEPALAALHDELAPISDMRASAAYRRRGAVALLRRALLELGGASERTRLRGHRPAEARA